MPSKVRGSQKLTAWSDSIFPEMTRLAQKYGAVNLSQGFPDFPAPELLKQAACDAIRADINQYSISFGARSLRQAVADQFSSRHGVPIDADRHVTICCGSTEAMLATMLASVDPGDEVIVFEPFYENYGPSAILSGGTPKYIRLSPPDWTFDPEVLERAFSNRTRAIVINTPTNPTGKVFTRTELEAIARLCEKWDVLAIADEIYGHIVFDGHEHVPIASIPGMAERTVTISGLSKTYSVTGWRIGWAIAPETLTDGIRKMHDFLTVAAPTPFHDAGVAALSLPEAFYSQLARDYETKRDLMMEILGRHGFTAYQPGGAYYVMADVSRFGFASDSEFAQYLVKEIGVATVPGSSFYIDPSAAPQTVRFCFSKRDETLHEADRRLARLSVTSGDRA